MSQQNNGYIQMQTFSTKTYVYFHSYGRDLHPTENDLTATLWSM
jgi:hypothetical protein